MTNSMTEWVIIDAQASIILYSFDTVFVLFFNFNINTESAQKKSITLKKATSCNLTIGMKKLSSKKEVWSW